MFLSSYIRWLHTGFPAGTPEPLPEVAPDGSTAVPGVFVVGDLTGIPLLKFAVDSGSRVVARIAAEPGNISKDRDTSIYDLAIIGAGVAGVAAAVEAQKRGLKFVIIESARPFATIHDFPKGKPIYTYPADMKPHGDLKVTANIKESLAEELQKQFNDYQLTAQRGRVERITRGEGHLILKIDGGAPVSARRVIIAIGRSGEFRRLGVEGEDLQKVYHRLHDPRDGAGRHVLVVGGGDSAIETAVALAEAGGAVTLSYRKGEFARPKPGNVESLEKLKSDEELPGRIRTIFNSEVRAIRENDVVLRYNGTDTTIANDVVYLMIGRAAPLDFFRKSGIRIRGEWNALRVAGLVAFLLFCFWLYPTKTEKLSPESLGGAGSVFTGPREWLASKFEVNIYAGEDAAPPTANHKIAIIYKDGVPVERPAADPEVAAASSKYYINTSLPGVLSTSAKHIGFWYSLAYSLIICIFGYKRYKARPVPYVKLQTASLAAIQVVPLFILPYIMFPWLGTNGLLPQAFLDAFFPVANYDNGREYWRAFGFILAWPLFIFNWMTGAPLVAWLVTGCVQTFVLIPLLVYFFGKGAYCGWICSCGALAETLGDAHRQKMPHGPASNRFNLAGQVILIIAALLMSWRVALWIYPGAAGRHLFELVDAGYYWIIDMMLAGALGVGFYFWYSGRVWCRFFCPLAALMNIYARFSQFRILSDKKKCISCNVCTSVCHQGIDVMAFANKGMPMNDPQCVRCSACVSSCPTGTLQFGRVDAGGSVVSTEVLAANLLRIAGRN